MRKMIALFSLALATSSFANELVIEYDNSFKNLKESVEAVYKDSHVGMKNSDILSQLNDIQLAFKDYVDAASEIAAKFKEKDIQLYADLSALNPKYCELDVVEDNTFSILAITNPAFASLALLDDAEVKFRLTNYYDLVDLNKALMREEFRTKMNKSNPKRFIRKLNRLRTELLFED